MSLSEELRQQMLREVFEYNAKPLARPGDLTVVAVVEDAKARGRIVGRSQALGWLNRMVATAGWETELVFIAGRKTRVWRKPESKD